MNSMGKCPVCGAPMVNEVCEYCGYAEKAKQESSAENTQNTYIEDKTEQEQELEMRKEVLVEEDFTPGVSKKSKTTALLLCIFLGEFGIHRFYVGKIGTGILYLLTAGLCGIGWIVDIIRIAVGSFRDEFDLPLRF